MLLDGLAALAARKPALGCAVYGPGTDDPAFGARAAAKGLFPHLVPLGELAHPQALAAMRLADAFVRPTRADGDSISVREALALGTRVVASDVGHRPPHATLFRSGDPADLAARLASSLDGPPPPPGAAGHDAAPRILRLWRERLGLAAAGATGAHA